jgi:molybdopterin synthase catalytic subunit
VPRLLLVPLVGTFPVLVVPVAAVVVTAFAVVGHACSSPLELVSCRPDRPYTKTTTDRPRWFPAGVTPTGLARRRSSPRRHTIARVTVTLAEIRETPLSVDEVLASVSSPRAGGVCLFVGTVRDHDGAAGPGEAAVAAEAADGGHGDRTVTHLDYSAHPQAADTARALAERLAADGRAVRLAVVHRVGHLEVGDIAVVVGVSAEHRGEAFDVCRVLLVEV